MKITRADVQYVAALANLELTDSEQLRMEKDLNAILDYVDELTAVETTNVEPLAQVMQVAAVQPDAPDSLRADELRDSLSRTAALQNAPQADEAFFRVPKVIER
jgi:aspartyl-tRNA(Asn)/glutamyl-tRNA(Gln) amidotransferase subunit C